MPVQTSAADRATASRSLSGKPSHLWLILLFITNFIMCEVVFAILGFAFLVPASEVPGETREGIALTALFYVPVAFVVSAVVLVPVLRLLQLRGRDRVWAASCGSWLPGTALGAVFYLLDTYTRAFHVFTPVVRVLWE